MDTLWAPWRMEFIKGKKSDSCVFCDALASGCPDRERLVLRLRFGIEARSDHTLEEIGGRLSVTRERVRQIEAKALAKLRRSEFAPVLRASVEA